VSKKSNIQTPILSQILCSQIQAHLFLTKKIRAQARIFQGALNQKENKKERRRKKPKLQLGAEIRLELQLGFFGPSSNKSRHRGLLGNGREHKKPEL
jgi:hypothetical protein